MLDDDDDLILYDDHETTQEEYDEMRARDIAEEVRDDLDNLTGDIKLAIENKPFKTLKKVLKMVNICIDLLDDVVSGSAD